MRDFQNAFDAALAGVDSTIVEVMGLCAQFTSGAQCGSEVQGVFDDPESLGFAGSGGSCYLWLNRGQPPAVNRRR
ncbi:hypothetical protein NR832_005544 [Escherichia coli]|nr:hypothetical protein [Escherichia coli]